MVDCGALLDTTREDVGELESTCGTVPGDNIALDMMASDTEDLYSGSSASNLKHARIPDKR